MKAAFEKQDQFLIKGRREIGFRSWLPSFHTHAELIYVIQGTIQTTVDGKEHTLRSGELSVIFPYVPHSYEGVPDAEALVLLLEPKAVIYETILQTMLPERHYIDGSAFYPLLSRAVELIQLGKAEAAQGYVTAVLGEFLEQVPLRKGDHSDADTVVRILEYCMENFTQDITMRDVSEALYMSQSQISKIFTHKIKCNFREYINLLRVDKAKELLADSTQKVLEVMGACGFRNQSSFNRVFLDYCGVSPREYRRMVGCGSAASR